MTLETIVILYVVSGVICGLYSWIVAATKNYDGLAWFAGGFFFGIIALIAIAGMPVASSKGEAIKTMRWSEKKE